MDNIYENFSPKNKDTINLTGKMRKRIEEFRGEIGTWEYQEEEDYVNTVATSVGEEDPLAYAEWLSGKWHEYEHSTELALWLLGWVWEHLDKTKEGLLERIDILLDGRVPVDYGDWMEGRYAKLFADQDEDDTSFWQ